MSTHLRAIAASCIVGFLGLTAQDPSRADAPTAGITIKNFMFAPSPLTIKAGSTVTWTNKDDEPHTVISADGQFRSSAVDTNGNYQHKFDKPGTYQIRCSLHPNMMGTIVVE